MFFKAVWSFSIDLSSNLKIGMFYALCKRDTTNLITPGALTYRRFVVSLFRNRDVPGSQEVHAEDRYCESSFSCGMQVQGKFLLMFSIQRL